MIKRFRAWLRSWKLHFQLLGFERNNRRKA